MFALIDCQEDLRFYGTTDCAVLWKANRLQKGFARVGRSAGDESWNQCGRTHHRRSNVNGLNLNRFYDAPTADHEGIRHVKDLLEEIAQNGLLFGSGRVKQKSESF